MKFATILVLSTVLIQATTKGVVANPSDYRPPTEAEYLKIGEQQVRTFYSLISAGRLAAAYDVCAPEFKKRESLLTFQQHFAAVRRVDVLSIYAQPEEDAQGESMRIDVRLRLIRNQNSRLTKSIVWGTVHMLSYGDFVLLINRGSFTDSELF